MTSKEKVRDLFEELSVWASENIPILAGFLVGMRDELDEVLPEDPAVLDQQLLEVGCLLITGRSDDAPPIGVFELERVPEEGEEPVWKPVHFSR